MSNFHERLKKNSRLYWWSRELYVRSLIFFGGLANWPVKGKRKILFYHLTGLGYGGTESFLQALAKYLDKDKYDVYYMYSDNKVMGSGIEDFKSRLDFILQGKVFPIRFDYKSVGKRLPYFIDGMSPDIFKVVKDFNIDLMVTAGAGHANFPFSSITNIPIILINVFGQPNLQKNIYYHLCISHEVASKLRPIVPENKIGVMYVPSDKPLPGSEQKGLELRQKLGIPNNALVFGRIGRDSNDIFDPIGIEAFKLVLNKHPNVHYIIISPPSILKEIVEKDKIPNVHFLPGSGRLEDLWAFYYAMDVLAHFRRDGESFGLNIAQAMLCGRPVISHKSHIWNAHLEYLTPDFSRVAEIDNVNQYAGFMEEFIEKWQRGELAVLGEKAKTKAESIVLIQNKIKDFEKIVSGAIRKV